MDESLVKIGKLIRDPGIQVDLTGFIFALGVSTLAGIIVSGLYTLFYGSRSTGSQVHRSFLLLSPSITTVFIAIQFSIPLSLGLLGALSIIRFRTPIKEPEEVGFIMLLIACAVVCATFQFVLLVVLLVLAVAVLVGRKYLSTWKVGDSGDGVILVSLSRNGADTCASEIVNNLNRLVKKGSVEALSSSDGLVTIQYSFSGLKNTNGDGIEGVLQRVGPVEKVNVYFNK